MTQIISFIGNCQTVALCYYLQELLKGKDYSIRWLLYDEDFRRYLWEWSDKCENKILDPVEIEKSIRESDIIIYQDIVLTKSSFSNESKLNDWKKPTCRLLKIPSMFLDYNDFNNSILEAIKREDEKKVDIRASPIIMAHRDRKLFLIVNHPTTFLFLEVLREICAALDFTFFEEDKYNHFISNDNYMGLP